MRKNALYCLIPECTYNIVFLIYDIIESQQYVSSRSKEIEMLYAVIDFYMICPLTIYTLGGMG